MLDVEVAAIPFEAVLFEHDLTMDSQAYPPSNLNIDPPVYEGQFGTFTITERDRQGVKLYRAGLTLAAICFAVATAIALVVSPLTTGWLTGITILYALFSLGLGVSLWTIHIYLVPLHRALQIFWGIGTVSAVGLAIAAPEPLALTVYTHPIYLLGIGFMFAALTGIFFKEAFCFDRLETKLLTPLVPVLLLGHLLGILPIGVERTLLIIWAGLFLVFALRKCVQPIPPDIGDKSVFDYLHQQRA